MIALILKICEYAASSRIAFEEYRHKHIWKKKYGKGVG
jgi:hypothetical protein